MSVVFVAGTGTEVGKTWWAAAWLRAESDVGTVVAARKPAQSFAPGSGATDADVLATATGAAPGDVCPAHRAYERPLAPPMAAVALARPSFSIAELVAETRANLADDDTLTLVEGVGGPRSPIAADGDNVDFAAALAPDAVLLVADSGLGTINAVRLSAAAFADRLIDTELVVALNRFDGTHLHDANRAWLTERDGFAVVIDPGELVGLGRTQQRQP